MLSTSRDRKIVHLSFRGEWTVAWWHESSSTYRIQRRGEGLAVDSAASVVCWRIQYTSSNYPVRGEACAFEARTEAETASVVFTDASWG